MDNTNFCEDVRYLENFNQSSSCSNFTSEVYYVCDFDKNYNKSTKEITENALDFFNHVNMTLYGYKCLKQNESISPKSVLNEKFFTIYQSCNNSICYFTNNPYLLFPTISQCNTCVDSVRFIKQWIPFLILGIFCLLGNGIVIFRQILNFFIQTEQHKEIRIFNFLILSLSMADILMGIYLTAMSLEIKRKSYNQNIYFTEYRFCNALGVISFISSQVSLSTIVLISLYRLYGVICPYKQVRRRTALLLILLIWTFWIILSLLPIANIDLMRTHFDFGIRKNELGVNNSTLFYNEYLKLVQAFQNLKNVSATSNFQQAVNMTLEHKSSYNVLQKAMQSFNILDNDISTWIPVGYYNIHFYCSMSLIVFENAYVEPNVFTLLVVVSNLVSCIVAIGAYTIIYLNVTDCQSKLVRFERKVKKFRQASVNNSKLRNSENKKIFFTITLIVVTDIIFWFGMCLVSLIYWEKYSVKKNIEFDNYLEIYGWFQSTMFCLIPINSTLNPFIYFHRYWYYLYKKLKTFFLHSFHRMGSISGPVKSETVLSASLHCRDSDSK